MLNNRQNYSYVFPSIYILDVPYASYVIDIYIKIRVDTAALFKCSTFVLFASVLTS
jgi:hypothetical protein